MNDLGHMISIDGLTKRFDALVAVDNISFNVARGEVLGFLGPNGAGKSTTMKMLTGYLPITSGKASVCGFDVETDSIEARKRIGYLPEGAPLYGDMTSSKFLEFIAEIRGYKGDEKKQKVQAAADKLSLGPVFNRPIETLSKGYKRRVGLAQAILHDPDVLILDEPTDGLDPNQKHQVRRLISEMSAEKAIIISTHILEEVAAVCTRAVIISEGKLVFDGSPDEFASKSPTYNGVTIKFRSSDFAAVAEEIGKLDGVERVENGGDGSSILVLPKNGASIVEQISIFVRDQRIEIAELFVDRGQLDDVFRHLTLDK